MSNEYSPPFPVAHANMIHATAIPHAVLAKAKYMVDSRLVKMLFPPSVKGA